MSEAPETTAAIRRGDPEVVEAVVRDALPALIRAARAAGLSPDRAEDAVHAAVLVFMRRLADFDGRARASTWLHGILWRTIAEERRSLKRDSSVDDIDLVMEDRFNDDGRWGHPPSRPDRELSRSELAKTISGCLESVPERQRVAFTLREIEGLATAEVRNILGVSANNLGVLLFRARNRLRECLEANDYGGGGGDAQL